MKWPNFMDALRNQPKPLVEEHYHIQELINAQQTRAEDRGYHQDRKKALEERTRDIQAAPNQDLKVFWCKKCDEDFYAESVKEVETDWSCPTQSIAFYRSKHWCGMWAQRLITDKHRDVYFYRSRRAAADKGKHYADTIQPYQTGFNMLYKKI